MYVHNQVARKALTPLLPQTDSLPVVVIVHVTQQPPAEATIFWDNAFAEAVSGLQIVRYNVCNSRLVW